MISVVGVFEKEEAIPLLAKAGEKRAPYGLFIQRELASMFPDLSLKMRLANQQWRKRHRSASVSALDKGSPGVAAPPHPGDLIPCDDAILAKPATLMDALVVG